MAQARTHRVVEARYDVDAGFELPDLAGPVASARAAEPEDGPTWAADDAGTHRRRTTYFDTADLDLARVGVTVHRRTGGPGAGWYLTVPVAGRTRSQVRLPLGRGATRVPPHLVATTSAVTEGRALVPVALIETRRALHRVVDADGRVQAEVADDRVTAHRLHAPAGQEPDDAPTTWREIAVEQVDGSHGLLDALDSVLRAAGSTPATSTSALTRTLGPAPSGGAASSTGAASSSGTARVGRSRGKRSGRPARPRRSTPAADVALAHLGAQVDQIRSQDLPVRLDVPGAVHAMRVASRRLRSALTTFAPLFDTSRTRPIGTELRWLAGVLGTARDAEVLRDRVGSAVDHEPDGARLQDAVDDAVRRDLDDDYRAAHDHVLAQLDSDRYRALLTALRELIADPPLRKRARRAAGSVLPALVARSDRRVRAAMRAAHRTQDPARREELLHDARKAAKRARYAAEAVVPVFGKDARRLAAAMEGVQEALGDHLDSLNTRARLYDLAARTTEPGTAFTYGRLHAQEDVRAEQTAALADDAWSAASRKKLRRWLG
ncbi:CYTH and CHAD domain-containing protein [Cellulomonas sp. S1-8]|uniref:CYTH and CHAD domain-containing protein n=1 Tax=Cellulomonas sp. S1-8 TaxID=2904790 RepID=UPI0022441B3C|nr:CYTH and CHAD domain-containing protein [Cellulomonas sp. S1-8]UZN03694.1 CYTH and CHAD domain-containing protein [Cellulomonas sp. S1-8]